MTKKSAQKKEHNRRQINEQLKTKQMNINGSKANCVYNYKKVIAPPIQVESAVLFRSYLIWLTKVTTKVNETKPDRIGKNWLVIFA